MSRNMTLRVAGPLGTRVRRALYNFVIISLASGSMSGPLSGLLPGPLLAHSLFPYEII